jgi:hypothetical protein
VESYEHLGEIKTCSLDLHRRYAEITEARRIFLTEEDSDLVLRVEFPTPPPLTWEWLQDPGRRNLWNPAVHWSEGDRPGGRAGSGASNHCAHGKTLSTEVTLDWRPFEYATLESYVEGKKRFTETARLEPLPDGGTRVIELARIHMPLPRFLRRVMARWIFLNRYKYDQLLQKAARLAGEEFRAKNPE